MATASVDRASYDTTSFGRYINTPSITNLSTSISPTRPSSDMAQATRPSSGQQIDQTASVAPSRLMNQDHNQGNSSHSPALGTQELVELHSTSEGILGPNKDGRVRNPVPSKLKGKTDHKQGSFGVMTIGKNEAQGRDTAAQRDDAARKTSENTASHAKAMTSGKYVPPKKRGPDPNLGAHLIEPQAASRGSPFAVSRPGPSRPLAPDETKQQQARLLTLLRSIQPITVVDQICKAVAYFGGIPGAPPPEDGIFPESANTRETGALFIGWLAEIFPDLAARSPEVSKDSIPIGGKKKGRPLKTGKLGSASAGGETSNESPNPQNGYGYGAAVSAPTWGLPPPLVATNTPVHPPILPGVLPPGPNQNKQFQQQSPMTPANQQLDDQNDSAMSASKRRRGRPKGSTNKKKGEEQSGLDASANGLPVDEMQGQHQPDSPGAQVSVAKVAQMNNTGSTGFTPVQNNQAATNKPAQPLQYSDQPWQLHAPQNQTDQIHSGTEDFSPEERAVLEAFRNNDELSFMPSPPVPVKVAAPEAGQKRKRAPAKPKANPPAAQTFPTLSPQVTQNSLNLPTSSNDASMGLAKDALQWALVDNPPPTLPPAKRIRNRKPKVPAATEPPSRTQTASVISSATSPIPASTIPDSKTTPSQQSIQTSVPVTRPPAEGLEAHYERGLMASLQQQQQNGRHTPTNPPVNQVQQIQQTQQIINPQQQATQHVRQPSKPSPSPLHQSIPLTQTQQMQRQKSQSTSQQNNTLQRDDQKSSQSNSARPSSTGYYNQRSQTSNSAKPTNPYGQTPSTANSANTYNQASTTANTTNTYNQASTTANSTNSYSQQYPSHQPSPLYANHQPSPQMSNNSYRSSSTLTLAQASPQFTQPETAYRTASPHIPQPSPSFSQPDTARSTNTYGLTQPSPSFTQAESSYRTPSHSMAQSTPSYTASRPHAQTQQASHQNPYGNFFDSTSIDLPTLADSLGHTGTSNASSVGPSAGYGQSLSLSNSRSSAGNSNSLYGSTSGLGNAFDAGSNDLLRGIGRTTSHSNSVYGTAGGLGAFDNTPSEYEMRERMMRGTGRR